MKKIITLTLMLCFALCTWAQTSATTALPLPMGDVYYQFSDASGYKTVYYTYTASSSYDELLTLTYTTANRVTFTITDKVNGSRYTTITGNSGCINMLALEKGKSIVIEVKRYNDNKIQFTAETTRIDLAAGQSCNYPVEIVDNKKFYVTKNASYSPSYLSYTATKSGTLSMLTYNSISGLTVQEGCNGNPVKLSVSQNADYSNSVSTPVEAGKTYIFSGTCYSSVVGSVELMEMEIGKTCDAPYDAVEKGNVLPAAAGEYWYAYTPKQDGYLCLTSAQTQFNGSVKFVKNCSAALPLYEASGYLGARLNVEANRVYLFCIKKEAATVSNQTFDLAIEGEKPGDTFKNPMVIAAGTHNTPVYKGKVYYKLSVPAENCFVTIESEKKFDNDKTRMELYSIEYSAIPVAEGVNKILHEAKANDEYILAWDCQEEMNNFPFTVTYKPIKQGEVKENPIIAKLGENEVTVGQTTRFYLHTMGVNGFMMVNVPDTDVKVEFFTGNGENAHYAMPDGNLYKKEGNYGEKVLIKLSNLTKETKLNIHEREFADGENCSLAIDTDGGVIKLDPASGSHWYRYVVPFDGVLTIATDIEKQTYVEGTIAHSGLYYRVGNCAREQVTIPYSSATEHSYQKSCLVNKGDIFLVYVHTLSPQQDKSLYLEMRDYIEGESPETAYPLEEGYNVLVDAAGEYPRWYYINLAPGLFQMESESSQYYFTAQLYSADNLQIPLTNSDIELGSDKYILKYNIAEENRYYVKITWSDDTPVTVIANIAVGIQSTATNGASNITLNGRTIQGTTPATVYDMSGKVVGRLDGKAAQGITLDRGVYVVKADGETLKVLVK